MLTFFHAPYSRSSTVAQAIEEMGLNCEIETKVVTIPRQDGSGGPDDTNPHPERKVPALDHDGALITERAAILAYLSDVFPKAPTAVPAGHPERGPFLMWLAYYAGVVEPMLMGTVCEIEHPIYHGLFGDTAQLVQRMKSALNGRDYLLESGFSAADLLMASPYFWNADWLPDDPVIKAWFARIAARPAVKATAARDLPNPV